MSLLDRSDSSDEAQVWLFVLDKLVQVNVYSVVDGAELGHRFLVRLKFTDAHKLNVGITMVIIAQVRLMRTM